MTFSAYLRAFAAIGAFFPVTALAQQQETTEPEVIVTAPLEGSQIESLQGATALGRNDVIENLNGGLGDTLAALPGVSSTFYGVGASRPVIRGLGDDRIRVLENGIGAIDASSASPDHAVTADGLDAHRIEVLRGAAALAYGGNAIGGVVNVIDESIPRRAPANALSFDGLGAYTSGNDGWEGSADVIGDAGAFLWRFGASGRETGDYAIPGFSGVNDTGSNGTALNSWTSYRAYAAGASVAQDWGYAGLAVKRTTDQYGLPPELGATAGGHIELEQTRVETRGDVRLNAGPFDRLDFALQHADYEHTEFEADGSAGTRFVNNGWEGRLEAHHEAGRLQGAIGLQAIDSDFAAIGDEAFITPTGTRDIGAFAVERWDAQTWGLEGGVRVEQRNIDNQGGGKVDFTTTSFSAGAFVRPAQNWFLGATLARTERAPTAIELFADGPHAATSNFELGDPDNDKEIALSFEISARYTTDPLTLELNLYNIDFDGYIALVNRGDFWWLDELTDTSGFAPTDTDPSIPAGAEVLPVFVFTQRDARFMGGELSASARLFETAGFTWRGTAAVDLVRADFDGGGHPPRIPPRTTTVGLETDSDNLGGRVEFVDMADQTRIDALETPTEGYQMWNARLTWRPTGAAGPLMVMLDGRNLTDEEGRVHGSFLKDVLPLPGRSVRLVLSADF